MNRKVLSGIILALVTLLLGVLVVVASPANNPEAVITVTITDPSANPGDGECSLIEAINNANADGDTSGGDCTAGSGPDTIELASSAVYTLTAVNNSTDGDNGLPTITSTVTISGQGSTIARSTAGPTPSFRLLYIGSAGDLTLNDLTLRNGYSDGWDGGGIHIQEGRLTLNSSVVRDNTAVDAEGGGISNDGGEVSLSGSIVSYNEVVEISTAQDSGAIANRADSGNATLTLINSQIISNTAAGDAGAIANSAFTNLTATLIISDSLISFNTAGSTGGGIWNIPRSGAVGATMQIYIDQSEISYNTANNSPGFIGGGGIFNLGDLNDDNRAIIVIEDSAISYNRADNGTTVGGGLINDQAAITITRSIINGNMALSPGSSSFPRGGGAIATTDGTVTIVNSTISDNETTGATSGGGAILNFNFWGVGPSIVRLINSTVSENSAGGNGGGVINVPGSQPTEVEFVNTILSDNSSADGNNCTGPGFISLGYNLEDGDSCNFVQSGDLVNTDPLLGPLQNNGGPTLTYALLDFSPAIDAGNDGICNAPLMDGVDQRGVARPIGPHCDTGAYESNAQPPSQSTRVYLPLVMKQ